MKCKNCGAELLETDRFCVHCGALVESRIKTCAFCGAELREEEKFCHRCGAEVPVRMAMNNIQDTGSIHSPINSMDTTEINILSDAVIAATQAQIGGTKSVMKKKAVKKPEEDFLKDDFPEDDFPEGDIPGKAIDPDEEYDEDFDDFDDDDDDDGIMGKLMKFITVIIVLLVAAVAIVFGMKQGIIPTNFYHQNEETQQTDETSVTGSADEALGDALGTVRIVKNVNVRDGASTNGTNVLGTVLAGEEYPYYKVESEKWYYIDAGDGLKGYVFRDYIAVNEK
ncbi:MAG: zinc-ribbon domain-containing protein [Lachnospiraceae bacterium]|nr:zinc-ribbon domain-containing protein [Lachnospiraceae bacterium]